MTVGWEEEEEDDDDHKEERRRGRRKGPGEAPAWCMETRTRLSKTAPAGLFLSFFLSFVKLKIGSLRWGRSGPKKPRGTKG